MVTASCNTDQFKCSSVLIENLYFNRPILKNQQLSMLNFLINRKTIIEYHRPFIRSDRRVRIKTLRSPRRTHQMLDDVCMCFSMVRSAFRHHIGAYLRFGSFSNDSPARCRWSVRCGISTGLCDQYDRRIPMDDQTVHRG